LFNSKLRPKTKLEEALDRAYAKLENLDIDSKEYRDCLDHIAKLHKMKEDEKPDSVSKDTVALIAANLLGIFMIIHHERVDIITSKALPFVVKPR